jgi:leucyl-tRNA synthetase
MGTVLANDEVIEKDGKMVSERGEFPVVKKQMRQWFMRITAYADRLLTGLETLDWSHSIKEIKRNWIGKSEGSEISFSIKNSDAKITVFTTRADTLFGVTYVVLAPEHELILQLAEQIKNWDEVEQYITSVKSKSDEDRVAAKEKTGIQLQGIFAINPANNEEVPVWIADYVLAGYGTGAVMAVPAHDERDFEFAKKYELPVNQVIEPQNISWPSILKTDNEIKEYVTSHRKKLEKGLLCYTEDNDGDELINSGSFSGMFLEESRKAITEFVDGKLVTKYKMRDAIFARQRYWGEPIPLVHEELPLKVFFLKESLQKGYDKELSKLSVSKSLHEDWGVNYFVKSDKLDQFIKTAQKLLLDKKGDIWYFDVSGRKQLVCYKKKVFEVTDPIQNELAKEHGRQGGIPEEQLDWKVQEKLDNNLIQTVPEKQLPLKLPNVKSYEPSGNGEGPLATVKSWVTAGYETNTMPGWAGSSWYFLRYTDPKNKKALASETELDYWFGKNGGVNMYVGGAEHATGHLLYSRFWHKVLKDLGHVKTEEPFAALRNQGMIGGADGRKMSKRWGNVINPDDVVADMGADTLRVYESFMGPFDAHLPWSIDGIAGARRFVERIWRFQTKVSDIAKTTEHLEKVLHKTIKKVSEDIQNFAFNTAVSAMMIFANELEKAESINTVDFKKFLQILAPFAPHITDELWVSLGEKQSIHIAPWPKFDPKKIIDNTVTIGIQINGKVRGEIEINIDESEDKIKSAVLAMPEIIKWMDGKEIKKFIYIKGRIINIVIG